MVSIQGHLVIKGIMRNNWVPWGLFKLLQEKKNLCNNNPLHLDSTLQFSRYLMTKHYRVACFMKLVHMHTTYFGPRVHIPTTSNYNSAHKDKQHFKFY